MRSYSNAMVKLESPKAGLISCPHDWYHCLSPASLKDKLAMNKQIKKLLFKSAIYETKFHFDILSF